jgi:acyl-CoA synthetase (AMP-forming)/AMP-acid ligase II
MTTRATKNIYEAIFGDASGRHNNESAVAALDLGKSNDPITYARLQGLVDGLRVSSAIEAGEKVALVMPNSLELIVGLFATWAQGAATAPLNPSYTAIEFKVSNAQSTEVPDADYTTL